MSLTDQRKYITETDIFDKDTRIDLIMDILDLIIKKDYDAKASVKQISSIRGIKEELLIRLLPNTLQDIII